MLGRLYFDSEIDDRPRSMRDPDTLQRRITMLHSPHMGRLVEHVSELRNRDLGKVPDFDPLDGGIEARVLFLLEKPGPKAFKSGFISRNNNDATVANTHKFMQQAGIPRKIYRHVSPATRRPAQVLCPCRMSFLTIRDWRKESCRKRQRHA